jgi:excisionase family DNA binding protein
MPEPFVTVEAAARFLAVTRAWLYESVRLGRVPSYKVGHFRRFRLSELAAWMEAQREGGPLIQDQHGSRKCA